MAYLLPRAFIVTMAWGMTCALIRNIWHGADTMIYAVAGLSWAVAGTVYFSYLRKLKRDIAAVQRRRYSIDGRTT